MSMTKAQAERRHFMLRRLEQAGFTFNESMQLRRIEMTLSRWHELECGTGDGQRDVHVERDGDDGEGAPFIVVGYPTRDGYKQHRYRTPDRERGAHRRLARLMQSHPEHVAYVQGDPRGCALYIVPKSEIVRTGLPVDAVYTSGVAVCD